jgi:prophage DNA circulation protein
MTDNELLQAMSDLLDQKLQPIKDELGTVQRDVKHLKKEAIKMQAMDETILDEVERVHEILDKHKEDKTVHTA